MKTPFFQVVMTIVRKDLRAEFRTRELVNSMVLFAFLSILVFSFALQLDRSAQRNVISGVLWVTIIFASMLGLNRSMAMEREQGNLDAMLLSPVDRQAIFLGKLIGNFLFTGTVGVLLIPMMAILFTLPLITPGLYMILILGTLGFSTIGTLLAAMTVQTRARESLLPIVMMPVALPLLLTAVQASIALLNKSPIAEWLSWQQILAVIDIIYFVLCYLTFEYVIEE